PVPGTTTEAQHKSKTPAGRRGRLDAWRRLRLAVSGVPGHRRDVRTADADVGQLAVAEARQLAEGLVISPPLAQELDDGAEHCDLSFVRAGALCAPANRFCGQHNDLRRLS